MAFANQTEKLWIVQQNKHYERQLNLMRSSLQETKTIKHDLKNHLSTVYSLLQNEQSEEALKHISEIIEVCGNQTEYAHSGNITVDSILNFKLQEAKRHNINVSLSLNIPEDIKVPSYDMAIILGNLLDNAINAVCKLKDGRFINLKIKYTKGMLIVSINNPFSGDILISENAILTTHKDINNHGIGLESVKIILRKYNGSMEIQHNKNIFSVVLLIYVD